jgi:hypothetical protein
LALLNTEFKNKLSDFVPSANLFDHAVVSATLSGKQVWVDATISNQGGNGIGLYFPPYGKALVLKAGNNSLTDIPQTKSGKLACPEKYDIKDEISPSNLTL